MRFLKLYKSFRCWCSYFLKHFLCWRGPRQNNLFIFQENGPFFYSHPMHGMSPGLFGHQRLQQTWQEMISQLVIELAPPGLEHRPHVWQTKALSARIPGSVDLRSKTDLYFLIWNRERVKSAKCQIGRICCYQLIPSKMSILIENGNFQLTYSDLLFRSICPVDERAHFRLP